ncbi:hypothetical protein [Halorussus ruber]|uniref:hypothetical protein n=1 Tax=Halorussus ruber TaxID=1126238 RepID=UPI001092000B|nr:hypothetical protein [Halorussus ruber]
MCHRRGEWSRTSSRASEPEEDPDENSAWVGARAKDLLVTFVSGDADETPEREKPEAPTIEAEPETPETDPKTPSADPTEVEEDAEEPEREEDPISADD